MDRFIIDHAVAFATWGEPVSWTLLAACLVAFVAIARARVPREIERARKLLGALVLVLGIGTAGVLYVLRGPFQPFMETTRRLNAGIGRPVPEIVFRRLPDGAPARLADLKGRVVLLNLWATWCPPCVHELPALHALEDRLGASGLVVVAVSDESFEEVRAFAERYALPAVTGSAEGFPWLPLEGFRPYSLVIDRRGILRASVFGTREVDEFERMIRPWL
jgi:thiol-disulfide isomerase/thioredoxin